MSTLTALRSDRQDVLGWGIEYFHRCGVRHPEGWIYFLTGNASAPRDAVMAVNGFDEQFIGWGLEDNELALRLLEAGLPFRYESRASAPHQFHIRGDQERHEHHANLERFFHKHPHVDTADNRIQLQGRFEPVVWARREAQAVWGAGERMPGVAGKAPRLLWVIRGDDIDVARRSVSIIPELQALLPDVRVRLISYGPAERWLRDNCPSYEVGNGFGGAVGPHLAESLRQLDLCELRAETARDNERWRQSVATEIEVFRPNLVVFDDQAHLLQLAHEADVPGLLLAGYLPFAPENLASIEEALLAKKILVPDVQGSGDVPDCLSSRVTFCGPLVSERRLGTGLRDWRRVMGTENRELIVIAAGDGGESETEAASRAAHAARGVVGNPLVVVMAGAEQRLRDRLPDDVRLVGLLPEPLELLSCADCVVVLGQDAILGELSAAGVPFVTQSLSPARKSGWPAGDGFWSQPARRVTVQGEAEAPSSQEQWRAAIEEVLKLPAYVPMAHSPKQFAQFRHAAAWEIATLLLHEGRSHSVAGNCE